MASPPPSSTMIQMPPSPQTNGQPTAGTIPAMPNDAGDVTIAPAAAAGPASKATDKVMSSAAKLTQLLPTGTLLAYQALSPSFTNHGKCEASNQWLTTALVIILAALCILFSFTDSVLGRDQKLYYGVATPRGCKTLVEAGFNVFNFSDEEEKLKWTPAEFRRLRIRPLDFLHAIFTALVFLIVALSDVRLQNCFFPNAGRNTTELLKNLPLGIAFLSSFVFIVFPTKRKGIGYTDTTPPEKLT
ncbi:protein DMP3-like [Triticum aestivum]|uniref:protein DMP3-like n=1 Tax=Triticum aestivum TaxID=4565 RepID=UPI001D0150CA|nr:protein DMP3-like [Triticum aestivum]